MNLNIIKKLKYDLISERKRKKIQGVIDDIANDTVYSTIDAE